MKNTDEVVIIGGGPAGSTMGSYLSMAGIKNTIFESAIHPRPHVGESLVTSTTRIFDEIGFLPTMEREGFVKKYGAAWHPPAGTGSFDIEFREFPQEGINQDYTYHVDRARFDLALLQHAASLGSRVIQGTYVKEVLFDDDNHTRAVTVDVAGQSVEIPAKMVVDASGRNAVLGRKLGIMKKDKIFDQFAVHAWFEDVDRGQGAGEDFIHIYFLPVTRGWAWQIPITDKITSIGVVTEKDIFRQSGKDIGPWFESHMRSAPEFEKAMKGARRVNEFKREGDYSYSMEQFAGDGWVLVGDAARFVDPIFSSGVSVAMYSAKFAAERIVACHEAGNYGRPMLEAYETKLRAGVENWYEFIRLYYKLLPLFTVFINSKKHRQGVLRLLQGEVFDREEVPVLRAMREYVETVEKSDSHLFKPYLENIPG